jgi:hypothetical protein
MKYHVTLLLAVLLLASSCEGWLHVQPTSTSEADKFLQKESGFKAALTGLYLQLKSITLYGQTLSIDLPEHMVNHWKTTEGSSTANVTKHHYKDAATENTLDAIFLSLYRLIAEANYILENIDKRQDVFDSPSRYHIVKGEALGLRAFCHLELLRWWGPIPGTQTRAKMLPYVRVISKQLNEYLTYDAYVAHLQEDLDEAERLLKDADPLHTGIPCNDAFYDATRRGRLNYHAVRALKARFYLWKQEKTEAVRYASEVISADSFRLANKPEFSSPNTYILPTEHLFELEVHDLADRAITFRQVFQPEQPRIMQLYETADARYVNWFENYTENTQTSYVFKKYAQNHPGKIPLIRLSEMYLIAIECNAPGANELYQHFCDTRGCQQRNINIDRQNIVLTEYEREFYGEGQLFFQYKRLSIINMTWSVPVDNLPAAYVMPLPKNEIIL